ncbi:LysR family transcriptional regulator [Methylosinus sp. Ce-a6]|uniref:LysR family transcriptional regulator n=1 Tax=Methylosinus sp. Ce-a6 TaxID=2172005 RepID=UPI00135A5C17|nr:LysR family transcriptional regulator [Methylosinus sp. Ce-a6]
MDWEDLRFFLVLSRCGSLSAAARELDVDHATVGRRIAALEATLGLRLIDRLPRSRPLTEDGAAIAAAAERMEALAEDVLRRSRGAALTLSGAVRVSLPPVLATLCVAPRIGTLRRRHPQLKLVLLASPSFAALDRGEADIAIRMSRPEEPDAVARQVGAIRFGLYASRELAERPAEEWDFVGFDASLGRLAQQVWLRKFAGEQRIIFESNDLFAQQTAARAGAGAAVLPSFMGDDDEALVRLPVEPAPPKRDLWLIAYPDLRRSPAVRAVMDFLADCIGAEPRLRP